VRALLSEHDPAVFLTAQPTGSSPFVLTCDHAGRAIPEALGSLGLSESELQTHVAWDIGIAQLGQLLSARLDAFLIMHNYSRLVIDVNRPPESPESIVVRSERTRVAGNEQLSAEERSQRTDVLFWPYHHALEAELERRSAAGRPSVLVALHSFTPVYMSVARPFHAGVLHAGDVRLAGPVLSLLRAEPGLVVGDNEPYAMSEETDYTAVVHGLRRGLLHVELEVRQDLLADHAGQSVWAERLATVLVRSMSHVFPAESIPR
jgi:predicted N-formylglutamate amidohydrolase